MNWNYNSYLNQALYRVKQDLGDEFDIFNIVVEDEQMFARLGTLEPKTIYVITKYLTNDIELNVIKTQPIQILILSEQDSLEISQLIFKKFVELYNQKAETIENNYIKQNYTEPVVLSNFNELSYGYRSVLYMSATLYIMEHIVDVNNLTVDNIPIEPLQFALAYAMTGNTQQKATNHLASTVKSVATLCCTITIPMLDNYIYTSGDETFNLMDKILNIINGTENGNQDFELDFYIGSVHFENFNMKITSAEIITNPNQAPSLQLGFIL